MAESPSPATSEHQALPEDLNPKSNQPDPSQPTGAVLPPPPPQASSSPSPSPSVSSLASSAPVTVNPSSTPPVLIPPPPSIHHHHPYPMPGGAIMPPTAPSFRPASNPPVQLSTTPQFSPLPNPGLQTPNFQSAGLQNPSVQPPGVNPAPAMLPNPVMRSYAPMPNGYPAMPTHAPQGIMPPAGVPRYPSPYAPMARPAFPQRPPGAIGGFPPSLRPPIPGRGPVIPPTVRPVVVPTPAEKPQTTVYVGRIAPTVENDFMLSLLRLCGSVKSWKRAQYPTDGTPKGFGFCEFEFAEGVLRALRLLSKFSIDGQELVLNVDQGTREFLEHYVKKKTESSKKPKENEVEGDNKMEESTPAVEKVEPLKSSIEDPKKDVDDESGKKENNYSTNFGIVNDEDREADQEAMDKLNCMIDERLKTKPLPPPPTHGAPDGSGSSNLEIHNKPRERDADIDILKNDAAEGKNDDDSASKIKSMSEQDKPETGSPDRSRRHERSSRDRDRERDKREKERELERYERERERERVRRERERELRIREAEQLYRERVKDWEIREREKEYQRQHEKEREKDRQHQRRKEIRDQEWDSDEDDDDSRKRRRRSEEKKRKRLREKEEDLVDRLKEEEEIAEARRREEEEKQQQQQQQKDVLKLLSCHTRSGNENAPATEEMDVEGKEEDVEQPYDESISGHGNHTGDGVTQNGKVEESTAVSDSQQVGNAPARKLGFGLMGSGRRTAVPSVFHEEEDDDAHKDKKMRPLVPIDYSTEELQAAGDGAPPNLAAATEVVKRKSSVNPKEEKPDGERERSKRPHDRSGQRDRERNDGDNRTRDENREKTRERDRDREYGADKVKTSDNKKLLDAKQLIDMIPRTKEELFSYEINWSIYDKHELHERMRPWISKKITEFLGEEEATLVDYIVGSTQDHVKASQMLELLQSILDDEAEMFVLKMWRMLIFEIKKVETGLSVRSKS